MGVIRIGIVSSQTLVRRGLLSLLTSQTLHKLTLVVDAGSLAEATSQIAASQPHILLIDCDHGPACLSWIQQVGDLSRSTKCLLLVDGVPKSFAAQAARNGAWGVLSKKADAAKMQQAIEKLLGGEMCFSPAAMVSAVQSLARGDPVREAAGERLTPREAEVLTFLAKGYRNKEIAQRLCLSESTVRTYLETIYRKTGAKSRVQAALHYYERNLLIQHPDSSD